MRIVGTHSLPFDCARIYRSLNDPAISVRCLPDFEKLERVGENEYVVAMRLAFDKLSGVFSGTIKVIEPNPPTSFKILVEGDVLLAAVKGEGLMVLRPSCQGTELTYDGDIQVSGAIAALGQRVIDTTAKMMIRKFFEKFIDEVKGAT